MERTGMLIERLLAQYHNKADRESLMITTQLILSELQEKDEADNDQFSSVSVFYPAFYPSNIEVKETLAELPEVQQPITVKHEDVKAEELYPNGEAQNNNQQDYDPIMDIPTLAMKQQEVNDTIAAYGESINDKLKSLPQKEVAHAIKDTPVKDLRKAIGINDRFVFINELFRGDETMYERSIKTINGYSNFAEAEFWIKRELKLKLGWNDNAEAVQLFDKLVRRRFA